LKCISNPREFSRSKQEYSIGTNIQLAHCIEWSTKGKIYFDEISYLIEKSLHPLFEWNKCFTHREIIVYFGKEITYLSMVLLETGITFSISFFETIFLSLPILLRRIERNVINFFNMIDIFESTYRWTFKLIVCNFLFIKLYNILEIKINFCFEYERRWTLFLILVPRPQIRGRKDWLASATQFLVPLRAEYQR